MFTMGGGAGETIDWLIRNFGEHLGLGGKGLYDLVVLPISGDFNRIRANGEAWADVGTMLSQILSNFGHNAKILVTRDWTGDAAMAFLEHVDVAWAGGLYVASKCAEWLQKGFDKLADLSIKIAQKCVDILNRLIDKILDLAKKLVPGLGWIVGAIEWISSGFDDFPYWSDLQEIRRLIDEILRLHETITNLVTAAQNYIRGFQTALDAVRSIPEIGSIKDATQAAGEYRKGTEQMKKAREDFDKNAQKYQDQLNEMDRSAQAGVG